MNFDERKILKGITIFAIFILGLYIRVYKIDLCRFGIDQSSHFEILYNFVKHGEMPQVGAYVGFTPARLAPFHYYLFLIPSIFSLKPEFIYYFAAFLDALVIPLIFYLFISEINFIIPLTASLFYAVSPYMVYVSREFWTPVTMPFFIILLLILLKNMIYKRSILSGVLAIVTIFIISQLHITGAVLIVIPIYLILSEYEFTGKIKTLFWGFIFGISTYLPWLYFQMNNNMEDILAYARFIFKPDKSCVSLNFKVFHMLFNYPDWFTNYIDFYKSIFFQSYFYKIPIILEKAFWLLSLVYIFILVFKEKDRELKLFYKVLMMLIFVPVILLMFFRYELYDRHLLLIFPVPYLIIGIFLGKLVDKKRGLILLLSILIIPMIFFKILGNFEFYRQVEKSGIIGGETPLKYKNWIIDNIMGEYGEIDGDELMGIIHPIGINDTATDFRVLYMLRDYNKISKEIGKYAPHFLFYDRKGGEYLKNLSSIWLKRMGNISLAFIPSLIDYSNLEIRRSSDKKWKKFKNPYIEVDSKEDSIVRGNIKYNGGSGEIFFSIFTNIKIDDFKLNSEEVKIYKNYKFQSETDEVHASERLFKIGDKLKIGRNRFQFRCSKISRWYNLNLYTYNLKIKLGEIDLLKNSRIEKWSTDGDYIEYFKNRNNLLVNYRIGEEKTYAYLGFKLADCVDLDNSSGIDLEVEPDGKKGLLRVVAVESNGEEWISDDYTILENRGIVRKNIMWSEFKNPDWGKRENNILDVEDIVKLELGFHYFREIYGTREVKIEKLSLIKR